MNLQVWKKNSAPPISSGILSPGHPEDGEAPPHGMSHQLVTAVKKIPAHGVGKLKKILHWGPEKNPYASVSEYNS